MIKRGAIRRINDSTSKQYNQEVEILDCRRHINTGQEICQVRFLNLYTYAKRQPRGYVLANNLKPLLPGSMRSTWTRFKHWQPEGVKK